MSRFKTIYCLLVISLFSLSLANLPAIAQSEEDLLKFVASGDTVTIGECPEDGQSKGKTNWIIKEGTAGSSIDLCTELTNVSDTERTVTLTKADATSSLTGGFTLSSNDQEVTGTGTWIDLNNQEVTLNSGESKQVNLKINIPASTKPGEYAAGLTITDKAQDDSEGNFNIKIRYGQRIYISVLPQEEYKLGTEFTAFEPITPDAPTYNEYITESSFDPKQIVMSWGMDITSNVFTKVKGKITITDPQGNVTEQGFNQDYFPRSSVFLRFLPTKAQWSEPGTYKIRFDFENSAIIDSNKPDEIPNTNKQNFVEWESTIDQATLDKMNAEKETRETDVPPRERSSFSVSQLDSQSNEESQPEEQPDNTVLYIAIGVAAAVIVIGGIAFWFFARKKDDDKESEEAKTTTVDKQ